MLYHAECEVETVQSPLGQVAFYNGRARYSMTPEWSPADLEWLVRFVQFEAEVLRRLADGERVVVDECSDEMLAAGAILNTGD